jgi:hypothetical protein
MQCRQAQNSGEELWESEAQNRLSVELRQQLLGAIDSGQPFRTTLRDLGLTPN